MRYEPLAPPDLDLVGVIDCAGAIDGVVVEREKAPTHLADRAHLVAQFNGVGTKSSVPACLAEVCARLRRTALTLNSLLDAERSAAAGGRSPAARAGTQPSERRTPGD